MILPSLADYVAAFRQLREVTTHPELKNASVWLDPGGNPVVFRGRESAVFCVRSQERKLAVKVFLGDFTDRPHRYAVIAAELRRLDLPYIVPFRFAEGALNIGGSSYPVGISYWADGEPLHHYIGKNLRNATALRELAVKWLHLSQTMYKAGIAHGDLEPNNILVSSGGIKLVDYDDFYVPELENFPSRTMGSPNFQHPMRSLLHFGPYLDNFSTWVIYTSLVAVSKDRELWSRVHKDGEQLLFTKSDLENPRSSEIVQQLKNTSDKVRQLAASLENLVTYDVPDVPPLDPTRIVPPSKPMVSPFATTLTQAPAYTVLLEKTLEQPAEQPEEQPAEESHPQPSPGEPSLTEAVPQRQPERRDSRRDAAPQRLPEMDDQPGPAPEVAREPEEAPPRPLPSARPHSVTTRELPTVAPSESSRPGIGLWAAVLVALAGIAAVVFSMSRGSGPMPSYVPHSESSPAEGTPASTTSDTATSTGTTDSTSPAAQEGEAPTTKATEPPQTAEPLPTSKPESPVSNEPEKPAANQSEAPAPNRTEPSPSSTSDASPPARSDSITPKPSETAPPARQEPPAPSQKVTAPPRRVAAAPAPVQSSRPVREPVRATASAPPAHSPAPSAPALKPLRPRSGTFDNSPQRRAYTPSPSYTPNPAPQERWPPQVDPIDDSPPKHAIETHPKFDRIRTVRARLDELKAAGVDTTTSRALLEVVETLAERGNNDSLEKKLQDLEYRLGMRASKD